MLNCTRTVLHSPLNIIMAHFVFIVNANELMIVCHLLQIMPYFLHETVQILQKIMFFDRLEAQQSCFSRHSLDW